MISKLMKKKNQKGFTLMEMLIVIAIIAVLVAIMIPTMTSQLEKAREAADAANIRSEYAEAMVEYLTKGEAVTKTNCYTLTQKSNGWDNDEIVTSLQKLDSTIQDNCKAGGSVTIAVDDKGEAKITIDSAS